MHLGDVYTDKPSECHCALASTLTHACPGAVGSARASQTGELKPAQTRLMEWPLTAASSRAPPSSVAQLPGLLEALGRMEACTGQAARMQALLSCQEVRSKIACCLLSMATLVAEVFHTCLCRSGTEAEALWPYVHVCSCRVTALKAHS